MQRKKSVSIVISQETPTLTEARGVENVTLLLCLFKHGAHECL